LPHLNPHWFKLSATNLARLSWKSLLNGCTSLHCLTEMSFGVRTCVFGKAVVAEEADGIGRRDVHVEMLQIQQRSEPHTRFHMLSLNTPHQLQAAAAGPPLGLGLGLSKLSPSVA